MKQQVAVTISYVNGTEEEYIAVDTNIAEGCYLLDTDEGGFAFPLGNIWVINEKQMAIPD